MYLRHTIRRKGGKEHTYWQLVRSVRRGGKVAQEVMAQLGELDAQGRVQARLLAARITGGACRWFRTTAAVACTVAVAPTRWVERRARLWCRYGELDTAKFGAPAL